MELTVKGLLETRLLQDAKIIAGIKGANKRIMGITIMEAPDIANWIKGGELILTSLYTLNTLDKKIQIDIIEGLHKKNVSAIGFKRRREEENIPEILLELGNKYNIPMILLDTEVPFIDIMNPIMAEIFNSQMIKLKHYKEVHNKFTALALKNTGLNNIIDTLADLVENPVSIYDNKFNCIYSTNLDVTKFNIIEEVRDVDTENSRELKYSKQRVIYNDLGNKEGKQVIVPVETVNNIKVYLAVSEINKELKKLDYITIENASTVICLELVKQFSVAEVEKKFKSDLIDDLINGNIKSQEELYQRANLIGLDINHKYIICLLNISKKDNRILKDKINEHKIHNIIYESINSYIPGVFIRSVSNNITLLWDIEKCINGYISFNKNIKNILGKIQNKINSQIDSVIITVGVSNIINSIENIAKYYRESQEALELGMAIYNKGSITSFEELGILRLLSKIEDEDELMKFIPNELVNLSKYDKLNKSDLLNTLEIFLNNGCNASKAAKSIYVHYKTIMYRLDRIKDITELDFSDSEKMLELQIGFKILKIIENKEKNS